MNKKMKYNAGDLVKLTDNEVYPKEFEDPKFESPILIKIKGNDNFVISPSEVMPIRNIDGVWYYPIARVSKSHSKKYYVSEESLSRVNGENDTMNDDNAFISNYEFLMKLSNRLFELSNELINMIED